MRRFLYLVLLFNWCGAYSVGFADVESRQNKSQKVSKVDNISKLYDEALRDERRLYYDRTNIEKIVGGSLAFVLGTYGYYQDSSQKIVGKLVYSATQSGGILALSSGIVGLSSSSAIIAVDQAFRARGELTYQDYKRIVVLSSRATELAEIQKTAISTGLLAGLYGYNCFLESKKSEVLRNTFGFLAFNFALFSGVSFYRWIDFDRTLISRQGSNVSMAIMPGYGLAVTYSIPTN